MSNLVGPLNNRNAVGKDGKASWDGSGFDPL